MLKPRQENQTKFILIYHQSLTKFKIFKLKPQTYNSNLEQNLLLKSRNFSSAFSPFSFLLPPTKNHLNQKHFHSLKHSKKAAPKPKKRLHPQTNSDTIMLLWLTRLYA